MSLSASWVDVPVVYAGTYYPSKEKLAGKRIVVEPLSVIVADDEAAVPKKYTFELDANGELTGATLPSTTNGDVGGVYYRVTEKWTGARDPFNILVLADAAEVNLATIAPVVDADLDLVSVLGLPAVVAAQAAQVAAEAAQDGAETAQAAAESAAGTAAADVQATLTSAVAASAAAASDSAAAAGESATTAAASATSASTAKTAAESARDAAQAGANVYLSTAAGLSAVSEGGQFMVVVGDTLVRYEDVGGVATERARYPTASAVSSITQTRLRGRAVDASGNLSFTPVAAYYGARQGEVFVADPLLLWQDTAMTIPAAVGQPVAAMEGMVNGYVALQATAGSRPVLAQDSDGNYKLDFTGNKWMKVSAFDMSASNRLTIVAALNKVAAASGVLCELSANVTLNNGTFFYQTRAGVTTDTIVCKGTGTALSRTVATGAAPVKYVVTVQFDLSRVETNTRNVAIKVRQDGVKIDTAGSFGTPGDTTFAAADDLFIGARNGTTSYFNNYLYALAIVGGSTYVSTIKALESDFGARCNKTIPGPIAVPPVPPLATPNYHIVGMGQSLANGTLSTPLQNTVARYANCYSFAGGVRPLDSTSDPGTAYASYVPMIERTAGSNSLAAYNASTVNETPMSGMCAAINQLGSVSAFAKLIGSVSGFGATSIFNLGRGNMAYDRAISEMRYGRRLSEREHRPHIVPAAYWMQGESDTITGANYKEGLEKLYANFCEDTKDATGQKTNPFLLTYQTAGVFSVAIQQLAAMEETDGIYMASPAYFLTRVDGTGHLDGASSELMGAYFGKALNEVLPVALGGNGNTDWTPLMPDSISYSGGDIDVVLKGNVGQVVVDTATVAAQTADGFVVTDASDANVTINSVTIVGTNTVRLSTSASVAAGFTVKYATALAGGNIRDSDTATYTAADTTVKPLYNWLVAFSEVLA